MQKKWDWVFVTLWQYYALKSNMVCPILKVRLLEFQNGKMGKNSSKIDQDTAKTVEHEILEILKIWKFSLRKTQLLNKNCYFSKFYVLLF